MEKITYEHLHVILLDNKYKDFLFESNVFSENKFTLSAEIKKINKILLTLSKDNIRKVYKIIKVFTKFDSESIKSNNPRCEPYTFSQPYREINKKEIFKIPEKGKFKNNQIARTLFESRNTSFDINLGLCKSNGKHIYLFLK